MSKTRTQFSRIPNNTLLALLCATCLLVLNGCASMKLKLGWRVDLTKIPVASIQASLPKGSTIAPGEKTPLVVTLNTTDGKTLKTEGEGAGKVMWKDLRVSTTVVTVNKKGVLKLPGDPRLSDGKIGHVVVTVPSQPTLKSELDVTPRYDRSYRANFSGNPGIDGTNGIDGMSGTSGTMGSIDPNNPSAGGDGSDGGNGTDGQDGGPGGDGPPVLVRLMLKSGTHPLLQVSVSSFGRERFYLIDPQGGSLAVSSEGGRGGRGGKGGRGGRGGSGGVGTPNGRDGSNGRDGRDGSDGMAGRSGAITVVYDPSAKPYLSVIKVSTWFGPAVFKEEPVGPLW